MRFAWALHLVGLAIVLPVVTYGFGIPLWLYVLVPVWIGQGLISIRTFAEHQWSERPEGRTIIVERSPLSFLFLNNNLHFVHHRNPTVAWYRLPQMFRERRDEWVRMNHGYVVPNYFALLKEYAFKAEGAGGPPGAAARAGTRPRLQAARARPQCQRSRHGARSGGAAEGITACQCCRICIRRRHEDTFIAALPMYEWPETRAATDAEWTRFCAFFQRAGIDAPKDHRQAKCRDAGGARRHPRRATAR